MAVAAMAAAVAAALVANRGVGINPVVFLLPAVMAAAWWGGLGPGILASLLGAAAVRWFFGPPGSGPGLRLALFTATALGISAIAAARKRVERELRRLNADLEKRIAERTGRLLAAIDSLEAEIAERRRAEEQKAELLATVEAQRQRLNDLMGAVPGVVWEAWGSPEQATQRIDYVSHYVEVLLGYSTAQWLSTPNFWLEIVHPEDRRRAAAEAQAIFAGKKGGKSEFRWIARDGRVIWVEAQSVVICDAAGTPIGMRGITLDVTHRKLADQALHRSEAKLRAFLEFASQAVVAVDGNGEIVLVNAQTEYMFGYRREELLGRELGVLLPEQARESHAAHARHFFARPRTRPMGSGLTLEARRSDGTIFPVEISLSYIDEGGVRLALALITDVSERKRLEEQLRQAAKLESVGVLAGGVAHDFNNLLTGIMGGASFALDTLEPGHPAAAVLDSVLRGSQRAAELTRQLLAYAGKGKFVIEPADLSALVRDNVRLLESSMPKNVTFELDLEEALPAISADVAQVQQLVMNLAINAAEAIGTERGAVTIRTRHRVLDEEASQAAVVAGELRPGKYVLLEVEDSGCGMDAGTLARIFDPFFTTKFTGRGLGLAAALGIVRGHRGALQVRSAPAQGSTFRVFFPASSAELISAARAGGAPEQHLEGSGTILVVDDEDLVRTAARAALERFGYSVIAAENGERAVELVAARSAEIRLVLLDLTMPVMGGEEALRRIRAIRPDILVLLSSGLSEAEAVRRFRSYGLAGFLQKPYTATALAAKVKSIAGKVS